MLACSTSGAQAGSTTGGVAACEVVHPLQRVYTTFALADVHTTLNLSQTG